MTSNKRALLRLICFQYSTNSCYYITTKCELHDPVPINDMQIAGSASKLPKFVLLVLFRKVAQCSDIYGIFFLLIFGF